MQWDLPCGVFFDNYADDIALCRTKAQKFLLISFFAFLFVLPLLISDRWLSRLVLIGINIVSLHGLNLLTGMCGQISLGHAGFMAVGGYASAILCNMGLPFWIVFPAAGLVSGLFGLAFGLPSLRVKGFYLAMATLAAQFLVTWLILQAYKITGGADGLSVPRPIIGRMTLMSNKSYYYLVATVTCLVTFFAYNLARTKTGRAFVAVRDNDLAAEVMGICLWKTKLVAFFVGCIFAGWGGALLVHYYRFASPEQFTLMDSIMYLGMLIVGGMGSTLGPIFGAAFFKLVEECNMIIVSILAKWFPAAAPQLPASIGLIGYALIVGLFLVFEPRGLAHRWTIVKNYYRLWPFSYW